MEAAVTKATFQKYPAYKDSGVEWLGEIPEGWKVINLKYFLVFKTGGTPSSGVESLYNGNEPWVTISDLNGRYTEKTHFISKKGVRAANIPLTKKGSLLFSFKLSVGQVAFAHKDLYTNEAIASFSEKHLTNLNFWYYSLPKFLIRNANTNIYGAYILNQDLINNAKLLVPSLKEQTTIANFLDDKTAKIDQAIAQKEKLIALLKERKQIVIQQAVTGKTVWSEKQQAFVPLSQSGVEGKDSGVEWIGEIPAHWEVKRVKHIFRLIIDPAPKNNDFELLSIYTNIGVRPRKDLEEKGNRASTTDGYWIVKKGDFIVNKLLAWMGAIGLSEYEGVTSPAYDILRPITKIENWYFHELFRTKICQAELNRNSRGIMEMRLRLYFDKFGSIKAPFPPLKEQQAIVAHLENQSTKIDQSITLQQTQIEKLKEYKAVLIDSAVTGKIKVN